jgi:transposase
MTMLAETPAIVIGVDTHKHTHSAAMVSSATGRVLEDLTIAADPDGYQALLDLAVQHSGPRLWAIEGAGSYGAGLAVHLVAAGEEVAEIERPNRPGRRHGAKSDPIDAARAAREALSADHLAELRSRGARQSLSVLLAARRSAVDASKVAQLQIHNLVIAAPEALRARFRDCRSTRKLTTIAARLRLQPSWDHETRTTTQALRSLARRAQALTAEAKVHEAAMRRIIESWRPDLLDQIGVGTIVAATLLCAWSHPGRVRSDAAFASLAGVAPIPASSGQTNRHRLNRSGDRQLNKALHTIVLTRLAHDPETRAYAERRRAEGKTRREIIRCLKRAVARRIYKQLENQPLTP